MEDKAMQTYIIDDGKRVKIGKSSFRRPVETPEAYRIAIQAANDDPARV